jgi:hypothetical protein
VVNCKQFHRKQIEVRYIISTPAKWAFAEAARGKGIAAEGRRGVRRTWFGRIRPARLSRKRSAIESRNEFALFLWPMLRIGLSFSYNFP